MSDPETLKILVDPDNLRALGEAPGLIEADFLDPNGFEPDVGEMGNVEGMEEGYDRWDGTGDDFDDYDGTHNQRSSNHKSSLNHP